MIETDPVLVRLAELGTPALDPALSARIGKVSRARLVPRSLPPIWKLVVPASVVGYLGWALLFASQLVGR